MKALILAGGFGTRLKDVLKDVPKPMAPVMGKPFLEYQIRLLREQGINEIILGVYHMSDQIKSYFGNGKRFAVEITYSEENTPLGTAGAIKNAQKYLDDTFIVLNGDSYSPVDIKEMLNFHRAKKSKFTICLTKTDDTAHYGSVSMDGSKLSAFLEKSDSKTGVINSGIYMFEPEIFDYIESDKNVSLEKEIFPKLVSAGLLYGYNSDSYFMDIGRPETYAKFKDYAFNLFLIEHQLPLREAMQRMNQIGSDMLLVVDEKKKLLGALSEKIINRFLLKGGNLTDRIESAMARDLVTAKVTDDPAKIQDILMSSVNRLPIVDIEGIVKGIEFRAEKMQTENYPIVRGKAPLRISFAGGGTDLPYFFEKHGGVVTSATIDKYCHASIQKRADSKIVINSEFGDEIIFDSRKDMKYDGKFDLVKAIVKVMRPDFGFELYVYNDIPPGRGLGSSATLTVLLVSLLSYLQEANYDDYKIAEIAYKVEKEELHIKGGWQDQYAAITGGFNFMEFYQDKHIIYPLRLKQDIITEFNEHLMLCYVGGSHFSGDLHSNQEKNFRENEEEVVKNLIDLKNSAVKIKDCLLTNNIQIIGSLMHESWINKKKINPNVTNPRIDALYETGLKNGAYGGKLLGAGGGGYILFFHTPEKRNQLKKAIEKEGGEVVNFRFEFEGTTIHPVKSKD